MVAIGLHLTLTGLALFALRIGLHLALLHEAQDEIRTDEPILCMECNHVVPDAPFCATAGCHARIVTTVTQERGANERPIRLAEEPADGEIVVGIDCPATRSSPARSR